MNFYKNSKILCERNKVKFFAIQKHLGKYPIDLMASLMGISRSAFYKWKNRMELPDKELQIIQLIEKIFLGSRNTYGSPRIFNILKGLGIKCSKSKLERLMKKYGIKAKTKRKFKVTTDSKHNRPAFDNILNREFAPSCPNKSWSGYITYIRTKEGRL